MNEDILCGIRYEKNDGGLHIVGIEEATFESGDRGVQLTFTRRAEEDDNEGRLGTCRADIENGMLTTRIGLRPEAVEVLRRVLELYQATKRV